MTATTGHRLLVVDDDRAIAEVVRQALTDEGYRLAVAHDGLDALERVAAEHPSLVVLDLMMPRLDGFGFLDRLRETTAGHSPSVIVMSARSAPEDIAQAIEKGASDFLTKPFDLDELVLRVRLRLARAAGRHAASNGRQPGDAPLEIHTFGGLRLVGWGRQLFDESWRNRTAKRLFKYLFTQRGQRLSREKLVETLWPGWEPEAGLNNLRVNVHVLRQTLSSAARATEVPGGDAELGRQLLLQQQGFYYFNTEAAYWSDVDSFEQHVRAGRAAQVRGDIERAAAEYANAMDLYRGPYLPEDVYDELLTRERERLRQEFFLAGTELMQVHAENGGFAEAVEVGRRMLREDHARESVYRPVMRYLARLGRRDEALQLYHRGREVLAAELGVEPLAETRDLYERIRTAASV